MIKFKKRKEAKLWHNGEIPARLFFEILASEKLLLLVKEIAFNATAKNPGKGVLLYTWSKIYDEFYALKDDRKLRLIMETKKTILQLTRTIQQVKPVLFALARTPFNEEQLRDIIKALQPHGIVIDLKKPLTKEVLDALTIQVAGIQTRLALEEDNLKTLTEGEKLTFEQNCVKFEEFDFKIDENVSLRKYVAYEKAVIRKSKQLKRTNHGGRHIN